MTRAAPNVAIFATCLVDLFRPTVGFATAKLLTDAGCKIDVPAAQTCCGQPAFNSGDNATTRKIAEQVIETFDGYDYVVVPSGSCAGMVIKHYPDLFDSDTALHTRALALAKRTFELVSFLTDVLRVERVDATLDATVTYHDSCSGLRELGIQHQPRKLLDTVTDLKRTELENADTCCGFGGTFCVKYSEISGEIVSKKTEDIKASGADMVLAGDMGCLMNIAGRLRREGAPQDVRHVAEVLAGMTSGPPIAGTSNPAKAAK
jgi:L-lactate dehydrogenase complex protein LldE